MHWIVPFAAPLADAGRAALAGLALPQLSKWLVAASDGARDSGDEWSFSAPHERALALAYGWSGGDGLLPWAAHAAAADGVAVGDLAWGLATPAHWHLGTDQMSLIDPESLALDAATSRTLLDAVSGLFDGDGYTVAWGAPLRWYLAHDSLAGLRTASLDRVVGRNIEIWVGDGAVSRRVRRLQSECQMLLYEHPVNAERESRGLLPVNSFWLSGCGVAQPVHGTPPHVDARLRAPALADDWAAWCKAWDTLDHALGAAAPSAITLCGERASATFRAGASTWSRLRGALTGRRPALLLEAL